MSDANTALADHKRHQKNFVGENQLKEKLLKVVLKDEYGDPYVLSEDDISEINNRVKEWLTENRNWGTGADTVTVNRFIDALLKKLNS